MAEIRLTGTVARPFAAMETLLATSQAWQDELGLSLTEPAELREAAARKRIHWPVLKADSAVQFGYERPFAVLGPGELWRSELVALRTYERSGSIWMLLEREVPTELAKDDEAAGAEFVNWISALMDDLEDRGHTVLNIREIRQERAPARMSERRRRTRGDFYRARYEIVWGT